MNDDALPCDHFCKYLSVQSTSCDALSQHCIGHRKMEQNQKQTSSIYCARSALRLFTTPISPCRTERNYIRALRKS